MANRIEVIEFARSMIGVRFRHQGRDRRLGVDCIGMILLPCWHFGLTDVDIKGYSRQPDPPTIFRFLLEQEKTGLITHIPKDKALPADFALFRIKDDPQHFGWISPYGIIHAQYSNDPSESRIVEHRMDRELWDRVIKVYRIRGIE